MKLNLRRCTFIIPVRIDSPAREFNFLYTIQYLIDNFDTNIIIMESDKEKKCESLLDDIEECKTYSRNWYFYEQTNDPAFHRTRLLNEMIMKVATPIVVNYDIDIILRPESYLEAQYEILHCGTDVCYPYFKGLSQKMVFRNSETPQSIFKQPSRLHNSVCGHCVFVKTEVYKNAGLENEGFIGYAPEDSERCERFQRMGYKVKWLGFENFVWHMEHPRGENSDLHNPYMDANNALFKKIQAMPDAEMFEYCKNQEYLKKYGVVLPDRTPRPAPAPVRDYTDEMRIADERREAMLRAENGR